jgi:RsiW-degrading membrane proteinase PrsW (M82 family)
MAPPPQVAAPSVVALAVVAAFIPALLWLWFFYRRDRYEREPKSLISRLFLWGLLSGPWAAGFNDLVSGFMGGSIEQVAKAGSALAAVGLLLALVFLMALNEETIKFVVTSSSTRGDPNFNERVDGIIYMTSAALGFAAGENVVYIVGTFFGTLKSAVGTGAITEAALTQAYVAAFGVIGPIRSIVTATGHVTWSGITGYFLGRHVAGGGSKASVTLGVFLGALLHTTFNFPQFLGSLAGKGLLSGYFAAGVIAWIIGLILYFVLVRRSLAASPFRSQQLAR